MMKVSSKLKTNCKRSKFSWDWFHIRHQVTKIGPGIWHN